MNISILAKHLDDSQVVYHFDKSEIIIGRSDDKSVDLNLEQDPKVSRRHARLYYENQLWWLADMGSKHGIWHDGNLLKKPIAILQTARIRIGDTILWIKVENSRTDTVEGGALISEQLIDPEGLFQDASETERVDLLAAFYPLIHVPQPQQLLDAISIAVKNEFEGSDHSNILLYEGHQNLPVSSSDLDRSHVSFTLAERAIRLNKAFIWEPVANVQEPLVPSLSEVTSAMYVPIIVNRRPKGVLAVHTKSPTLRFQPQQLNRLIYVGSAVGQILQTHFKQLLQSVPSVFLSYSHRDVVFIKQLVSKLRKRMINVWYDDRLRTGEEWPSQIRQAIETLDGLILVLSPNSVCSEWVKREYQYAIKLRKPVFPVLYGECSLPTELRNIQYVEIRNNDEIGFQRLVEDILDRAEWTSGGI